MAPVEATPNSCESPSLSDAARVTRPMEAAGTIRVACRLAILLRGRPVNKRRPPLRGWLVTGGQDRSKLNDRW